MPAICATAGGGANTMGLDEYITLKSALQRIRGALAENRTVIITDGTVSRKVAKVYGNDQMFDEWMTVETDDTETHFIEITPNGYLEGWDLRNLPHELMLGPGWYVKTWPCGHICIANYKGICAVSDCQGACTTKYTSNATCAEEAAQEYTQVKGFLAHIEKKGM